MAAASEPSRAACHFKGNSFFPCGATPSKPLPTLQPLKVALPLLRSEEGESFRKERDGGERNKKKEKGRAKSGQMSSFCQDYSGASAS